MLEIKHLTKTYKKAAVKAVDDVNLVIEDGDIYGFIGPNGAGKSTTIKCVVGIHDYEGEILLDGISVRDNEIECKKKMAYVPIIPIYTSISRV